MKRVPITCILLLLPLVAMPVRADDAADQDLVGPVNKAIDRGIQFLRDKYNEGDWENSGYPGMGARSRPSRCWRF